MNILILIFIIIVLIYIFCCVLCKFNPLFDNFDNVENKKIVDIFTGIQNKNETFFEFKEELDQNKINFNQKIDNPKIGSKPDFSQYVQLISSQNSGNLTPNTLENIRKNI